MKYEPPQPTLFANKTAGELVWDSAKIIVGVCVSVALTLLSMRTASVNATLATLQAAFAQQVTADATKRAQQDEQIMILQDQVTRLMKQSDDQSQDIRVLRDKVQHLDDEWEYRFPREHP